MDLFSYLLGKKSGGGGSTPTGTINITENGTYDVTNYASAEVEVTPPVEPTLPNTYLPLNYLEATGTQYIDTGYVANINTKIEVKFKQPSETGSRLVFGSKEPTDNGNYFYSLSSYSDKITFFYNISSVKSSTVANGTFSTAIIENDKFTINGEENTGYTVTDFPVGSIYLFGQNFNGSISDLSKVKIGSFKIYENNILIHHFVPCMRISDTVLGMYDLIGETFKVNEGSGTFKYSEDYL